jgi:type IV pilus assembly protein PilB
VGDILVEMGAVTAEALDLALARKLGIPFVRLQGFKLDPAVLELVTADLARKNRVMPLLLHDGRLVVALENPTGIDVINLLRFTTRRAVEVVATTNADIQWAIDNYYSSKSSAEVIEELNVAYVPGEPCSQEQEDVERLGNHKPVVKLVNSIIIDAVRRHASDIHIRAGESQVNLFFRIHGTLSRIGTLSKELLPAIVSRIKILSRLDIAERRLPQDGRTHVQHAGTMVDLRISIIPTVCGESVVIRILDRRVGLKSLDEIGFSDADREAFREILHRSHGLILVTGPTGSGKSTTLYAALTEIRRQNVNIITVEDPVEYHIDGIEQIQANTTPGYDFALALRHILRHDPDVIMIGEIRDEETGKIAIESALTGHLVLSTLHTNDAAGTVTRLVEMGLQPYLLSSTLVGVLAQRLARCNCQHCASEEKLEPMVRKSLGVAPDEVFYRSTGCENCNQTGFGGRVAVYELLRASDALRGLIVPGATVADLHRQALADGMVPLTEQALQLARQRVISLSEVYRVRLL